MSNSTKSAWTKGFIALVVAAAALPFVVTAGAQATPAPNLHAGEQLGSVHAKGAGASNSAASTLMSWHKGQIMTSADVKSIFWGSSWSDATKVGDKIGCVDTFYAGVGSTSYMNTNTEFTGTNGQVGATVAYQGHAVDLTAAGTGAPSTSAVLGVVARNITSPAQ